MKSAAAPLITLLNSATQLAYADLLTITLTGGQVLRYSGADVPLTISGVTWGMGPAFRRSKISSRIGVQVDTLDIEMYADSITPAVLINGVPLIAFVANGGLDNARILLERAFASDWLTAPAGKLRLFSGRVAEIEIDVISAKIKVHSDLELLDVPRPTLRPRVLPMRLNIKCHPNPRPRRLSPRMKIYHNSMRPPSIPPPRISSAGWSSSPKPAPRWAIQSITASLALPALPMRMRFAV